MTHRFLTQYSLTVDEITRDLTSLIASGSSDCGCSFTENDRLSEDMGDDPAPATTPMLWKGVLGVEGELTGDGRYIQPGVLRWESLPIPIRYVSSDVGAHQGAVVVGHISTIERLTVEEANERLAEMGMDPLPESETARVIWGEGDYDLGSEVGREAARMNAERLMNGVSMDLDDVAFEVRIAADAPALMIGDPAKLVSEGEPDEDGRVKVQEMSPDDEVMVTTDARIRAATQVAVPAFSRAMIYMASPTEPTTLSVSLKLGGATFDVEYPVFPFTNDEFNWVDDVGGLPKYIRKIADAIKKKGKDEGHAIAIAVNAAKKMCATGDLNFPGDQDVNPGSKAQACEAVAEWEAKKAKAKADNSTEGTTMGATLQVFDVDDQWRNPDNGQWIDMPGEAIGKLIEAVEKTYKDDVSVDSDAATLEQAVGPLPNLKKAIEADLSADVPDADSAKTDVQEILDSFPFEDYEDNEEVQAAKNALEAFNNFYIAEEQTDLDKDEATDIDADETDMQKARREQAEVEAGTREPDLDIPEPGAEAGLPAEVQAFLDSLPDVEYTPKVQKQIDEVKAGEATPETLDSLAKYLDKRGYGAEAMRAEKAAEALRGGGGSDTDAPSPSEGEAPSVDERLAVAEEYLSEFEDMDISPDVLESVQAGFDAIFEADTPVGVGEAAEALIEDLRASGDLTADMEETIQAAVQVILELFEEKGIEVQFGSMVAAALPHDPDAPPAAHFSNPNFKMPTPLTITNDGRVMGHLAVWGTCHLTHTNMGKCVTPPKSRSGYAYFATGSVLTKEGAEIPVGQITLGTGHAGEILNAKQALAHYDNTGKAVADITVGEDAHGIWFSGSLRPGVTAAQVRTLRAHPLSGDWRRMAGSLELVASLCVNVQGFPVPRPKGRVANGSMQTLVAAGMLPPRKVRRPGTPGALSNDDLRYLKRLAARERMQEQEEKMETLAAAERLAKTLRSTQHEETLAAARRIKAQQMAARVRTM